METETKKKIYICIAVVVSLVIAIFVFHKIHIYNISTRNDKINEKYEKRMKEINDEYKEAERALRAIKKYED